MMFGRGAPVDGLEIGVEYGYATEERFEITAHYRDGVEVCARNLRGEEARQLYEYGERLRIGDGHYDRHGHPVYITAPNTSWTTGAHTTDPNLKPLRLNEPRLIEEVPPVNDIELLRAEAQSVLARLADAHALEQRFPSQPPENSVMRWMRTHGSGRNRHEYTYVALRVEDNWYVTGTAEGSRVLSWDVLRREIGTKPCWLATAWGDIPMPEKAAADAEVDPAKWLAIVYPDKAIEAGGAEAAAAEK